MICRPPTGAGNWQFNIEPSGALIWMGRKLPSLFGTAGETAAFQRIRRIRYTVGKGHVNTPVALG